MGLTEPTFQILNRTRADSRALSQPGLRQGGRESVITQLLAKGLLGHRVRAA
jgi:hypothetical protein